MLSTVDTSMTDLAPVSSLCNDLGTDIYDRYVTNTNTTLDREFCRGQLEDVPGLLEYLFPDKVLPLPLDVLWTQLASHSMKYSSWNPRKKMWSDLPDLDWYSSYAKAEQKLATFLNQIGTTLRQICADFKMEDKIPLKPRVWQEERTCTPLSSDTGTSRKSDLTLRDERVESWSSVLLGAEVRCRKGDFKESLNRLNNAAHMIFSTQDERRFSIGVSFTAYDVRVYVFDRAGIVGSEAFNFCDNPKLFIRLLAGLTLAARSVIGFDPTIIHENDKRFVIVDGKKYEIVERLFMSDHLRGRGTVCWRARLDGFDYVIKDTWADVSRNHTEPAIMRDIVGVDGVAQLIADEVVVNEGGKEDSTRYLRDIIDRETYVRANWLEKVEVRIHRRIVTTPFGHELPHFGTQKELLSALIDAIKAHQRLIEKKILHRDISLGNIIMYHPVTSSHSLRNGDSSSPSSSSCPPQTAASRRKGLLIDLDFSIYMTKNDKDDDGIHRPGTLPFMAIDLLRRNPTKHEPRHDLESFFYVLMWICWCYAGPHNVQRHNFNLSKTPAKAWINGEYYCEIGMCKFGFFRVEDVFEEAGMTMIAPYFNNLKPCLRQLRDIIYENTTRHEDVIKILQATVDELPDVETWSAKDDEEGYGLRKGSKRTHEATRSPLDERRGDEDFFSQPPKKRARSERLRHYHASASTLV